MSLESINFLNRFMEFPSEITY